VFSLVKVMRELSKKTIIVAPTPSCFSNKKQLATQKLFARMIFIQEKLDTYMGK